MMELLFEVKQEDPAGMLNPCIGATMYESTTDSPLMLFLKDGHYWKATVIMWSPTSTAARMNLLFLKVGDNKKTFLDVNNVGVAEMYVYVTNQKIKGCITKLLS